MSDKIFTFFISEAYNEAQVLDFKQGTVGSGEDKLPVIRWKSVLTNPTQQTANKVLYTKEEISNGLAKPYVQKRLEANAFYNEMAHPTRDNPERYMNVNDQHISDRILSFTWEMIDGVEVLVGECETATFSRGEDLRRKILSGSNVSKSLRAGGNIKLIGGKPQKDLLIVAYDNVFIGADAMAWGLKDTFQQGYYETKDTKANILFKESNLKEATELFKPIKYDVSLIAESFNGFTPTHIMVDNNDVIGFYSESMTIQTKIDNKKMMRELNEFLKG